MADLAQNESTTGHKATGPSEPSAVVTHVERSVQAQDRIYRNPHAIFKSCFWAAKITLYARNRGYHVIKSCSDDPQLPAGLDLQKLALPRRPNTLNTARPAKPAAKP